MKHFLSSELHPSLDTELIHHALDLLPISTNHSFAGSRDMEKAIGSPCPAPHPGDGPLSRLICTFHGPTGDQSIHRFAWCTQRLTHMSVSLAPDGRCNPLPFACPPDQIRNVDSERNVPVPWMDLKPAADPLYHTRYQTTQRSDMARHEF